MHFLKEKTFFMHIIKAINTLDDLLKYAKSELEFMGGKTSLNRIIKSMCYKFRKVNVFYVKPLE